MSKSKGAKYGKAWRNAIARPHEAQPPPKERISREQWVIRVATRIVGTKMGGGFVQADDVVSDILLKLLDAGGFNWDEEQIETFCRREAAFVVRKYLSRKERSECEFSAGDDNEEFDIIAIAGVTPAMQEIIIDARRAVGLLAALPFRHRRALNILCDGGNPIDVAEELRITPWAAIQIIKEARSYLYRVDPLDEAA